MSEFTAPDGTSHASLQAYKKHVFDTYLRIASRTGETIVRQPGQIAGQQFQLSKLEQCQVQLLDYSDRVVASDLEGCRLFVGPSAESVVLRRLKDCHVTVACKELRLTDCVDCTINSYTCVGASIESSSGIVFGNFNGAYSGLTSHFAAAGLDPKKGSAMVTDFSSRDDTLPTPHFTKSAGAPEPWAIELEGAAGPPENPTEVGAPDEGHPPPTCDDPLPDVSALSDTPAEASDAAPTEGEDEDDAVAAATAALEAEINGSTESEQESAMIDESAAVVAAEDAAIAADAAAERAATAADVATQEADAAASVAADKLEQEEQQKEQDPFAVENNEAAVDTPEPDPFAASKPEATEQQDAFAVADDAFATPPPAPEMTTTTEDVPVEINNGGSQGTATTEEDPFGSPTGDSNNEDVFSNQVETDADPFGAPSSDATPAADTDPFAGDGEEEEETAAFLESQQKFKDMVTKKDEENTKKRSEMRDNAEAELEQHYTSLTDAHAIRAAANREHEADFVLALEAKLESSKGNPWDRVLSMLDLNQSAEGEGADKARMRGLLLRLKADAATAAAAAQ